MSDEASVITPQVVATIFGAGLGFIASFGGIWFKDFIESQRKNKAAVLTLYALANLLRKSKRIDPKYFGFLDSEKFWNDLVSGYKSNELREAHLKYLDAYTSYRLAWSEQRSPSTEISAAIDEILDEVEKRLKRTGHLAQLKM